VGGGRRRRQADPAGRGARPRRLALANEDTVYYSDFARGFLGRLDLRTGAVKEWQSPSGPQSQPYGIAFTKAGNTKFGSLVLEEIKRRIEGKTDLPMTTLVEPPPIVAPGTAGPVFGSSSQDGQFTVTAPPAAAGGPITALSAPILSDVPISARDLVPGSSAERLYVQGIAQPAPAGRFDDYQLPKKAD